MTPLEIIELVLKFLTLVGLLGIVAGVSRRKKGNDFLLYSALGFTAAAGALWIIVSLLLPS